MHILDQPLQVDVDDMLMAKENKTEKKLSLHQEEMEMGD